jgi:cell division transport system permease protein
MLRHAQVALASLGRLCRAPLSNLMTTTVIGIALALPAGLHVILDNLQQLSAGWEGAGTVSLFLKSDVAADDAHRLAEQLGADPRVAHLKEISPDEAFEEFRRLSGFSETLQALDENPLPAVLVLRLTEETSVPREAQRLLEELTALKETDFAQLDLEWVQRFAAMTEIARRGVMVVAALLALAVLLVIGNTIRLEIQNRRAEIEITKLIGATDAFIRRPFLYSGLWFGLLGGAVAWLLVSLSMMMLNGPVERLAGLYHSGFDLSALHPLTILTLLAGSSLLGLAGSWIAVARHLRAIEPT